MAQHGSLPLLSLLLFFVTLTLLISHAVIPRTPTSLTQCCDGRRSISGRTGDSFGGLSQASLGSHASEYDSDSDQSVRSYHTDGASLDAGVGHHSQDSVGDEDVAAASAAASTPLRGMFALCVGAISRVCFVACCHECVALAVVVSSSLFLTLGV
jgi:hypothetical protein